MSQLPLPGNHAPLPPPAPPGVTPAHIAQRMGDYVRSMVLIVFWSVVAAAALAGGYIAIRVIWWAGQQILRAMGV